MKHNNKSEKNKNYFQDPPILDKIQDLEFQLSRKEEIIRKLIIELNISHNYIEKYHQEMNFIDKQIFALYPIQRALEKSSEKISDYEREISNLKNDAVIKEDKIKKLENQLINSKLSIQNNENKTNLLNNIEELKTDEKNDEKYKININKDEMIIISMGAIESDEIANFSS